MKVVTELYRSTLLAHLKQHALDNRLALVWEDETEILQRCDYEVLYERVCSGASYLQTYYSAPGKGRHGECRVGVWLPRGADFIISFLSIWMAGGVFVPITDASLERLQENSTFNDDFENRVRALAPHLDLVITDHCRIPTLTKLTNVKLVNFSELQVGKSEEVIPPACPADSEAFIYCSSGTTATPKIISIPHEGIADRVCTVMRELAVNEGDCIFQYTGFDFDPSLMEIFMALQFGTLLIIAPEFARINPKGIEVFFEKLTHENLPLPNIAIIVPSMLKLIPPHTFSRLKSLMTTGENIRPKDLAAWFAQHEQLRIFTGYGPTETTWGATLTEVNRDPIYIHITTPMQGIEIKLLPAEDGLHEILIAGNGHGYYLGDNAEEQTQKNWMELHGKRYFRPYDAITLEAEKFFYAGRIDDLIKYHGQWVSLDLIDGIVESFPGIQHATTVSVAGALVFIFVVADPAIPLNAEELGMNFRQNSGGELFPTFFTMNALKFNARGKRCRNLRDYAEARPFAKHQAPVDTLSLVWTQALAEVDSQEIQDAFKKMGIDDYHYYLPQYAPTDRFDQLGGRSIKLPRLLRLLWDTYSEDPKRAQQTFKIGIMRHQSFQEMSQFIHLYQVVMATFSPQQFPQSQEYTCLWLTLSEDLPENSEMEFCELLEAEIKSIYQSSYYHFIVSCSSPIFIRQLQLYFFQFALVDNALAISSPQRVQQYFEQLSIRKMLGKPPQVVHAGVSSIALSLDTPRITLLGTACGKTAFLLQKQAELKRMNRNACYLSVKDLLDEKDNLSKLFNLSENQWEQFCVAEGILSEMNWFIDDVEYGIFDNRLAELLCCLKQYKGSGQILFAGRENSYPYLQALAVDLGQIYFINSTVEVTVEEWFTAEAEHRSNDPKMFYRQLSFIHDVFKRQSYLQAIAKNNWWVKMTLQSIQQHNHLPAQHYTRYPAFSSMVRFLTLHDTDVYSIQRKYVGSLEAYFSQWSHLAEVGSHCFFSGVNTAVTAALPSHIQYFPGENCLHPWVGFHSISGNSPEGYQSILEIIREETQQAAFLINMPELMQWETLEAQVESYLNELESSQLIPDDAVYSLFGWSYGGYLAVVAAQQLERRRKKVLIIVNLDAAPVFSSPHFPWEKHQKFIQQLLMTLQATPVMMTNMQKNVRLLQSYAQSQDRHFHVQAKHYIFEASEQLPAFQNIPYHDWSLYSPALEQILCGSDHFGIFATPAFQTAFRKILSEYHEPSNLPSLKIRLREKAQTFLDEQAKGDQQQLDYLAPALEQQIHDEFLADDSASSILVIEGEPGVGKTRLISHIMATLLQDQSDTAWFPVIFPLRLYLGIRDVNSLLSHYGLSTHDLHQPIRYLFILEAVDEGDLDFDAYPLKLTDFGLNARVVITVRSGFAPFIAQKHLQWTLPLLDEQTFKACYEQIEGYSWFFVSSLFESKSSQMNWLKTFFFVNMLKRLKQSGSEISTLILSPYQLYSCLHELMIAEGSAALGIDVAEYRKGYDRYRETLTFSESVATDSVWNYPDPYTQSFKKSAQLLELNEKLFFSHITWRDFHIISTLIAAILNFRIPKNDNEIATILTQDNILNHDDFSKTDFRFNLLRSYWESSTLEVHTLLHRQLFTILQIGHRFIANVTVSRVMRQLAATLLKLFRISFSDGDLSGTVLSGSACSYSPDGLFFITADCGEIHIYDTLRYLLLFQIPCFKKQNIPKILVSPQNRIVCYSGYQIAIASCYGELQKVFSLEHRIYDIAFSPDSEEVAVLTPWGVLLTKITGVEDTDEFLSIAGNTLSPPAEWRPLTYESTHCVGYSPTGTEIAAIQFNRLRIWDRGARTVIEVQDLEKFAAVEFSYHPARPLLFVLTHVDIYVIDTDHYDILRRLTAPNAHISHSLVLDPLSNVVYGAGRQVSRHRFDVPDDLGTPIVSADKSVSLLRLSRDGSQLLEVTNKLSSARITQVNLSNNQIVRSIEFPFTEIKTILFQPDEAHFVYQTSDNTIYIKSSQSKPAGRYYEGKSKRTDWHPQLVAFDTNFLIRNNHSYSRFYPHDRSQVDFEFTDQHSFPLKVRGDQQQIASYFYMSPVILKDRSGEQKRLVDTEGIADLEYVPPDGKKILVLSHFFFYLYDTSTGTVEKKTKNTDHYSHMVFSPDGKFVVARNRHKLLVMNLEDLRPVITFDIDDCKHYRLIAKYYNDHSDTSIDEYFKLHAQTFQKHAKIGFQIFAYDTIGQLLYHSNFPQAVATENTNLIILNLRESGTCQPLRLKHDSVVLDMSYRPSTFELAAVSAEGSIYFWNMKTLTCLGKKSHGRQFDAISFTHDGELIAMWGAPIHKKRVTTPVQCYHSVQLWDPGDQQIRYEIRLSAPAHNLVWQSTNVLNGRGNPTYTFACWEGAINVKVYEVVITDSRSLEVNLVWVSHSLHENHIPDNTPPTLSIQKNISAPVPIQQHDSPISLDTFFRISSYLCYRDYCHFTTAYHVSPALSRQYQQRPLIDAEEWRQFSPVVGEQLQKMGFFRLRRPADIHHLTLTTLAENDPSATDTYQTVRICETTGEICGDIDVYVLDDCLRVAKF